jgi:trans-aconitate methyltransferase
MNIDSWKNKDIFNKQLILNIKELDNYPDHWKDFIQLISPIKNNITSILDIGCGCGTFYELCKRHFSNFKYTGVDYSDEAIQLAKKYWKYNNFFQYDFWSLTPEYISLFDLIHCGALFDVLPNGDIALEKLLSFKPNKILIGRINITNKDSFFTEYLAYDSIQTYQYYHNINKLNDLFIKYNYNITIINTSILLETK